MRSPFEPLSAEQLEETNEIALSNRRRSLAARPSWWLFVAWVLGIAAVVAAIALTAAFLGWATWHAITYFWSRT